MVPRFALLYVAITSMQGQQLGFEVVSIKPTVNDPAKTGVGTGWQGSPTGWTATSIKVVTLISQAYRILEEQILGAPKWVSSDEFDIAAKYEPAAGNLTESQTLVQHRERLRAMLKDRFQFSMHRETREGRAFVLVAGKIKLPPAKDPGEAFSFYGGDGFMSFKSATLDDVAEKLSAHLARPVANRTGIDGRFDFRIEYEPELRKSENPAEFRKPSFAGALEEQAGLKLESRKAPVEILVVDRIEHPTGN